MSFWKDPMWFGISFDNNMCNNDTDKVQANSEDDFIYNATKEALECVTAKYEETIIAIFLAKKEVSTAKIEAINASNKFVTMKTFADKDLKVVSSAIDAQIKEMSAQHKLQCQMSWPNYCPKN